MQRNILEKSPPISSNDTYIAKLKTTTGKIITFFMGIGAYLETSALSAKESLIQSVSGDINDFSEQDLRSRAFDDTNAVGLVYLGPPKLGINIALVSQLHDDKKLCEEQLSTILSLAEPNARLPYEALNLITGASFLLADNTSDAMQRHKTFARYLKPRMVLEECKKVMPQIFESNKPFDAGLINIEVTKIFSKVLFGAEATPLLVEVITGLEEQLSFATIMLPIILQRYFSYVPSCITNKILSHVLENYFPNIIQTRQKVDDACRDFFQKKSATLQGSLDAGEANILLDAIRELRPRGVDLTKISADELNQLADHPIVRSALFSLFAIDNAAHTISKTAEKIAFLLSSKKVKFLKDALDKQETLDATKLPIAERTILEALYSWGLMDHSKFTKVYRYTKKGIKTEVLDIPSNTLIICSLSETRGDIDCLEKMLIGRNLIVYGKNSDTIPSVEALDDLVKEYCITPEECKPLIIKLNDSNYYVYGKTSEKKWAITFLGQLPELDNEMSRGYVEIGHFDSYSVPDKLYQAIKDKNAHLPFNEPERLREKVGTGKFTFFGKGLRSCPAATDVAVISKFIIMTMIKNFENYSSETHQLIPVKNFSFSMA